MTANRFSPAELEHVITRLRGVVSSRVVMTNGTIDEIHVLAGTGRPAKQIVRDIETAFHAHFGLPIDHRKISVAQLDVAAGAPTGHQRIVLRALKTELTAETALVHVTLSVGDAILEGEAEGPRSSPARGRLAALATVQALQSLVAENGSLLLDQCVYVPVGPRCVCLVSLVFARSGREERLLGAALVEADHMEPAVKATLKAVNRRLLYTRRADLRAPV